MWLLYQFLATEGDIITRGRNPEEAKKFLVNVCQMRVIGEYSSCDITAAYQYSKTHQFDWLNSPLRWLGIPSPWLPNDKKFCNRYSTQQAFRRECQSGQHSQSSTGPSMPYSSQEKRHGQAHSHSQHLICSPTATAFGL